MQVVLLGRLTIALKVMPGNKSLEPVTLAICKEPVHSALGKTISDGPVWWGEAPDRPVSGCEELRLVESPDPVRAMDAPSRGTAFCSYIWWGLEKW